MTLTTVNRLLLLLSLAVPAIGADQVYSWIDANGVTHFSETPPPDPDTQARFVDIPPAAATASADDDFYSVINQAERMEKRRLENEKLAAEKQQAEAVAARERAETAAIQQGSRNDSETDNRRYYPVFPYYPPYGHHPWKPGYGHRPKPVHPIYPGYSGIARSKNPRTSLGKTPGMPR